MKNILSITMLALLCAASCKKENKNEDQLPPATQTGANTFGCLVNGKVWIPKGFSGTGTPNPKKIFDFDSNGVPYLQIDAKQFSQNIQNGIISGNFSMKIKPTNCDTLFFTNGRFDFKL